MNLDFNEEQDILRSSAKNFIDNECPKEMVREIEESTDGYSRDIWNKMVELGWMGIVFPEEYGGYGGSFIDMIVLLEEMGRGLLPSPFFSTVVLCGQTILEVGTENQKKELLGKIVAGETIMSLAMYEPDVSYTASGISVKATPQGDDYVIDGIKMFVNDANIADYLLVVARTKESGNPEDGISIFIVDTKSSGITCNKIKSIGSDNLCEIIFNNVKVSKENILGEIDKAWPALSKAINKSVIAKCAEVVGGMEICLDMTNIYAKERVQYGKTIGSYQAIQHYLANMLIKTSTAKNMTYEAAWYAGEGLPESNFKVSATKSYLNEAFKYVSERGVQIHGGVGMTREYDIGLYYRRARSADVFLGDTDHHLELVAQELGL